MRGSRCCKSLTHALSSAATAGRLKIVQCTMRRDCTLGPSLAPPLERLSVALPHHTKRRRATRLPWHLFAA
ncbi:hypothetical protein L665_01306 [Ralstonia solanacearum SD54]|nr:hypothetical protein L665_01306 [Ralstonia solanacearum SD54]